MENQATEGNGTTRTIRTESGDVVIRRISESDSIAELTDLLHRAYKRLADMGLRFFATYQTEEQTRERVDDGECYVAILEGKLIGTIAYYPNSTHQEVEWYRRPDVAHFGQFAVEPGLQRMGIGASLLEFVELKARTDGFAELALDTAEGATHLIAYYTDMGYRHVGYTSWDITNYRSVVLSKML